MSSDRRLVLGACYLTMLLIGDNSTAVMAALPAMTRGLGLGSTAVEWIVNAYLLASAVFIVLGGEAADRFGARRSSAAGAALFALASLALALAGDGVAAIGARALQGVGAALAVPGTLAAVSGAAADSDRGRAIGGWTGFLMLGFSVGPLVGGAVTHYAGWRVVFWLNVGLMVPAAGALFLNSDAARSPASRIDWPGLGLLALFMMTLVEGMRAMASANGNGFVAIGLLGLAAVAFIALFQVETRKHRPLVDFGLFRVWNFALASALAFLLMSDIMVILLYFNLFAQSPAGLGRTPIEAGLSLAPLSIALFGFARAAPWLASAIGMRRIMVVGSLLLGLGCAIAWASVTHAGFAVLLLGLSLVGAGVALPYASAPRIGLAALSPTETGKGSGVLNSCSFLGGALGVTAGGIAFGMAGFEGVLTAVGLSALLIAVVSSQIKDP
jgi:MFS family permease